MSTQPRNTFHEEQPNALLNLTRKINQLRQTLSNIQGDAIDLESTIQLNKQAATILLKDLASQYPVNNKLQRALTLMSENLQTLERIRTQRLERQAVVAKMLIQSQVNDEQEVFFRERLFLNTERIDDLRKLMHDKEYGYSNVVEELNKFEELPENQVEILLTNIGYILTENTNRKVLAKLSHEKYQLATNKLELLAETARVKRSLNRITDGILKGMDYQKILTMFNETHELKSQGCDNVHQNEKLEESKHTETQDRSANVSPPLKNVHKQLMTIVKRQVKARKIMAEEFKESVGIGQEVKSQNLKLQETYNNLKNQSTKYSKHIHLLQERLKQYCHKIQSDFEEQVDVLELRKEQGSSTMLSNPRWRGEVNKKSFHQTFLIKCGSEPDHSFDEKPIASCQQ